jgi:hypothetical protein
VGYGDEDPRALLANPRNWRIHPQAQQDALAGVLDAVGWVSVAAIVNKRTGFVVDGHLRVALAISRAEKSIPVGYVDLTPAEEDLILASFDSVTGWAVADGDKLGDILADLSIDNAALSELISSVLADAEKSTLREVEGGDGGERQDTNRQLGDKSSQIKPVLYTDQIAVFERALRATGEKNRGRALIRVCAFYVESQDEAVGQLDV